MKTIQDPEASPKAPEDNLTQTGDHNPAGSTTMDMTQGPIISLLIAFALPLLFGNIFQLLYSTVDTWVVGKFVGAEALAAVSSTTMISNIMVMFFNGLSIGATVIISQNFGAKNLRRLHDAIETTMAMTFIVSIAFSVIGYLMVGFMLGFMDTPADVMPDATTYLRIYFAGISGLLIYNMGSGILRAVGDTRRPLYFLVLTSVLNIILDLVFVLVLGAGVAGVAYATILSQFISALLVLLLLTRTRDIYRLIWRDLRIDLSLLGEILGVGLPAAIQSMITAFSNVFVQSYVNHFGSACMAGWGCYNKLDQYIFLPMSSIANSTTTFVGQNIGARQQERANRGTVISVSLSVGITLVIASFIWIFARPASAIFSDDASVIRYSVLFLRQNVFFLCFNCVNHVLAAALRGRGDSRAPMIIMLANFVVVRQIYLYVVTHFVANVETLVGFGYPVGWMCCCLTELTYFFIRYRLMARD